MQSPYDLFKTDTTLESTGIRLDYGPFYVQIARAGGGNKAFNNAMKARMEPYRRAIQTDTMDEKVAEVIVREVYADTVIRGWGSTTLGDGVIFGKDGEELDFTRENVLRVLEDLPDLYADVRSQAEKVSLFRVQVLKDDAGNSAKS